MKRRLWILRALLSHWRRHPLPLAALLGGLAIATALWSGVQAVNSEARASYERSTAMIGGGGVAALAPQIGDTLPGALFATLRRAGAPVSPVLEGGVRVGGVRIRVLGIEPFSLPQGGAPATLAAGGEAATAFLAPPWRALASAETLERLGLAPDGPLEAARATEAGRALPPLIRDDAVAPGVLLVDIGAAEALLGRPGEISRLLIPTDAALVGVDLDALGLTRLETAGEFDPGRLTDSFHLNLTAFGLLAFLVGLFIVYAAIGLATEQRLGLFRTLRASGVAARELTQMLLLELIGLALAAGLIGVALGYALAGLLLPDVALSLRGLYGVDAAGVLTLRPEWWLASLAMSLVGALAAAVASLWRVHHLPPLQSAAPEAWAAAHARGLGRLGLAALALAATGVALYAAGEGLLAGFAVMACALLAAALALPVLLDALLRGLGAMARRRGGPTLSWALADMRQQSSSLSLALMALLLALAANTGVGSMVEGFRSTFLTWLDQRLAAEVYFRGRTPAETAEMIAWAEARPETRAVLPAVEAELRLDGWPVGLRGIRDHATYRDAWTLLAAEPDAWDRVFAGDGVLVSEQTARRLDLRLGDPVPIAGAARRVAGVYADYGNPRGQIIAPIEAVSTLAPGANSAGVGVRLDPGMAERFIADMTEALDLAADQMIDQRALKRFSAGIFESTFAVTAALNVLTLAVSGVALFASLLTLADRRLVQLAPIWAMGVTRRRLAVFELAKLLGLALLTALLAVPLGVLVTWLLVSVINVEAFGWRLPLHVFPAQWAVLTALALLVAAAAAAAPLWRLSRTPPAALAKVFAHAR